MPRTPGFDALGFGFAVSADDQALVDSCTRLFHTLARREPTIHEYSVRPRAGREPHAYDVSFGAQHVASVVGVANVGSILVHDVTQKAVSTTDHLVLHAGGIEHGGVGVAFPGVTAAGKTTLVAGLVRAGMGYLTDEAFAVDRHTLRVEPYPKPLSMDPGSWPLFPELITSGALPAAGASADEWQVPPDAIRPDPTCRAVPIDFVVFPCYRAEATTCLEVLGRGEALVEAAHHTFAFGARARENLDLLAEVLRRAACLRLTIGSLDSAVDLVAQLVGADDLPERV